MRKYRVLRVSALILAVILAILSASACGQKGPTEVQRLAAVADKFFAAGKTKVVSVDDVYNNIVKAKDPGWQIVDIRSADHYALGHVEGAINIPYKTVVQNIDKFKKDKKILVICYTGQTAGQTSALLNMLGYDASSMSFGMLGWTKDEKILGIKPWNCQAGEYPVTTAVPDVKADNKLPELKTKIADDNKLILDRAGAYLALGKAASIKAADINTNITAKDASYFYVDVRKAEHYAKGHATGAINIPLTEIAKEASLKKLPTDKKIVLFCYSGQSASQATIFLNMLGYDAYAAGQGMMAWTSKEDIIGTKPFGCKQPEYPTAK